MDRLDTQLTYCPLLDEREVYIADTVDLTQDHDAREYWLQCFQDAIDKVIFFLSCKQGLVIINCRFILVPVPSRST